MTDAFEAGQELWRARQSTLRQIVRQHLVTRQLAAHVPDSPPVRVLDVGCGQGTQLLALAGRGHRVTGVDTSAALLGDLAGTVDAAPADVRGRVTAVRARIEDVGNLFADGTFDVVLCHGLLMYVTDPRPAVRALGRVVTAGGTVSLLVRNGDALALRPALLGDWPAAAAAFDGTGYVNRLQLNARADRLSDLVTLLDREGLVLEAWYGVRVFTDVAADDAPVPPQAELDLVLDTEERAGRTDPYRSVAALTHVIARRAG